MKKAISLLMVLAMLFGLMPTAAFAATEEDTAEAPVAEEEAAEAEATADEEIPEGSGYLYSQNGYTLEKISHADVEPGEEDGLVDYYECYDADGNVHTGVIEHQEYTDEDWAEFAETYGYTDDEIAQIKESLVGDGCQSYCYSAMGYGDYVYIGTMYGGIGIQKSSALAGLSAMGLTTDDAQYNSDLADAVMNALYGDHYYVEHISATEGILVKINVKTGESKILMAGSVNGMEPTLRGACEYNGKLYFVGAILQEGEGEGKGGTPLSGTTAGAGSSGMPSIYEIDPEEDTVKLVYQATDAAGYAEMVANRVFPTLRTIINYNGTLIASVTDENGAHFIAYTPTDADYDEDGNFKGITVPETGAIRNSEFKVIADQETELYDYPAYTTSDSNYGGTVYQVIEYNGDLYAAINCGRATLGTAKEVTYNEETGEYEVTDTSSGCYRGWAIVKGEMIDPDGPINDKSNWTWTPIVGNTDDDQWPGSDGALYTFDIDPERYAPATCTLEVYNGYLYIGDYDDVTLATFTALYTMNFHHLATNLQQSINLYRLDEDMNVELVVGDATDMFPDGSITGLGSGYYSHTNQYTAKATVWDPDTTDDNDGILFYSTLDEATILRPLCELTNGDLLEMSASAWKEKIDYIRVLLQLVINNKLAEDDSDVDEEVAEEVEVVDPDFNTIDSAKAFIYKLIDAASDVVVNAPSLYADEESEEIMDDADISAEPNADIELTDDAIDEISEELVDEELVIDIEEIDVQDVMDITLLAHNLTAMTELIESNNIDSFYQLYLKNIELYNNVRDKLPESVTEKLDSILTESSAQTMKDLLTCLTYLQDSIIGCDVYAITTESDGSNLELTPITCNGLGDSNNHTMRNFATTDDYLIFCTGNPVKGAQLWRLIDWPGKDADDADEDIEIPDDTEIPDDSDDADDSTSFIDVDIDIWYTSYVELAIKLGLMTGMGDNVFAPDANMTREQYVTVLSRLAGADVCAYDGTETPFTDVDPEAWYAPYVAWAYNNGITAGMGDGTFGVGQCVTREQMAVFLYAFTEGNLPVDENAVESFADADQISWWAAEAVDACRAAGLFAGDENGCFNPQDAISRAEAATVFVQLYSIL